jgi:glycosyltransferase involved in cell wall biosynthesis
MKVAICTPTLERPKDAYLASLEASVPLLDSHGIDHQTVFEVGCPYISAARATMLSKAMKAGADTFIFIDDDMGWRPQDLLELILKPGDIVCGTYRFKTDEHITYMGVLETDPETDQPMGRSDGCLAATRIPAGFLKVTLAAVNRFRDRYPDLRINQGGVDLFNHGVIDGIWHGEDYAFSRRMVEMGEQIWIIPWLKLDHYGKNGNVYPGDFHEFLMSQPGGINDPQRQQ